MRRRWKGRWKHRQNVRQQWRNIKRKLLFFSPAKVNMYSWFYSVSIPNPRDNKNALAEYKRFTVFCFILNALTQKCSLYGFVSKWKEVHIPESSQVLCQLWNSSSCQKGHVLSNPHVFHPSFELQMAPEGNMNHQCVSVSTVCLFFGFQANFLNLKLRKSVFVCHKSDFPLIFLCFKSRSQRLRLILLRWIWYVF